MPVAAAARAQESVQLSDEGSYDPWVLLALGRHDGWARIRCVATLRYVESVAMLHLEMRYREELLGRALLRAQHSLDRSSTEPVSIPVPGIQDHDILESAAVPGPVLLPDHIDPLGYCVGTYQSAVTTHFFFLATNRTVFVSISLSAQTIVGHRVDGACSAPGPPSATNPFNASVVPLNRSYQLRARATKHLQRTRITTRTGAALAPCATHLLYTFLWEKPACDHETNLDLSKETEWKDELYRNACRLVERLVTSASMEITSTRPTEEQSMTTAVPGWKC
nr:hypothetical protein CFP56_30119 [Quercus suber]